MIAAPKRNRRRSQPGNRNGRLVYPVGTELRTVQVVLSFEDWREACRVGDGKAARGLRQALKLCSNKVELLA